jgi:hypothetical protein
VLKLRIYGAIPSLCWEYFSSPLCPEWLWGPPSILSNEYQEFFLWGVKLLGHEADHSAPSSAEVKELVELYLHSPNTPWRGARLKKHRDDFTFTFNTFTPTYIFI